MEINMHPSRKQKMGAKKGRPYRSLRHKRISVNEDSSVAATFTLQKDSSRSNGFNLVRADELGNGESQLDQPNALVQQDEPTHSQKGGLVTATPSVRHAPQSASGWKDLAAVSKYFLLRTIPSWIGRGDRDFSGRHIVAQWNENESSVTVRIQTIYQNKVTVIGIAEVSLSFKTVFETDSHKSEKNDDNDLKQIANATTSAASGTQGHKRSKYAHTGLNLPLIITNVEHYISSPIDMDDRATTPVREDKRGHHEQGKSVEAIMLEILNAPPITVIQDVSASEQHDFNQRNSSKATGLASQKPASQANARLAESSRRHSRNNGHGVRIKDDQQNKAKNSSGDTSTSAKGDRGIAGSSASPTAHPLNFRSSLEVIPENDGDGDRLSTNQSNARPSTFESDSASDLDSSVPSSKSDRSSGEEMPLIDLDFDEAIEIPILSPSAQSREPERFWESPSITTTEIKFQPRHQKPLWRFMWSTFDQLSAWATGVFIPIRTSMGPEPPVPEGKVRVRWNCKCGESLWDDFIEKKPGAARELEEYLNQGNNDIPAEDPTRRPTGSPTGSGGSDTTEGVGSLATPSNTTEGGRSVLTPSPGNTLGSQEIPTYLPPNAPRTIIYNPFASGSRPYIDVLYLLVCANHGRFTPKVTHLDVTKDKVHSDRELALVVKNHYRELMKSRFLVLFKMFTLVSIEFVQFEVHRNQFADIRKSPDMPPIIEGGDYEFERYELVPPVGSTYLMHLFKHPHEYDGENVTYSRIPKRRSQITEFGPAWGIHLVEGYVAERVYLALIILSTLGSIVFVIVWVLKAGDIQTAFSVASFAMAFVTLVFMYIQSRLA